MKHTTTTKTRTRRKPKQPVPLLWGSSWRDPLPSAAIKFNSQETQYTIGKWALDTFGEPASNLRIAIRANEEMAELLRELSLNEDSVKAASEVADIFIVLYQVANRMDFDVHAEIDRKMQVNRARKWELDGSGHGRHIK